MPDTHLKFFYIKGISVSVLLFISVFVHIKGVRSRLNGLKSSA